MALPTACVCRSFRQFVAMRHSVRKTLGQIHHQSICSGTTLSRIMRTTSNHDDKLVKSQSPMSALARTFHSSSICSEKNKNKETKNKDIEPIPGDTQVIVLGMKDGLLKILKMAEAQKLAEDKGLNLVYVNDKTQAHPVFTLMSSKELNEMNKQMKGKTKKTVEKSLKVKNTISDRDLEIKIKNIREWLAKGNRVNVSISKSPHVQVPNLREVMEKITKSIKGEAEVRKPSSRGENDLNFLILPKAET